jgi:MFS family permease
MSLPRNKRENTSQTGATTLLHGARLLTIGLVLMSIYGGLGYYAFGVFFKPIQENFNWERGVTSIAFAIFYIILAVSSPFIGRLTDRHGTRKTFTLGALILSSGLTLLSLSTNLLHFYIAYGITGLGCSTIGMIPVSYMISSYFKRGRGTAIGIVSSGMGIGGFVLPLIIGIYLIPHFGWRTAYQILALSSLLLILVIVQTAGKANPKEVEPNPPRVERSDGTGVSSQTSMEWTLNSALKAPAFWLITCAFILFQMAQVGTTQHLVNHLTDIGFSIPVATSIFSITNLFTAIGKLMFGYVSDRLTAKHCAMIVFLLGLVATAVLMILNTASSFLLIGLYVLSMGLAIGGWAPITSMLISTNFGMTHYGDIFGAFSLFFYISTGISPTFFGYIYDTTHQYYLAYAFSLLFYSTDIVFVLIYSHLRRGQ